MEGILDSPAAKSRMAESANRRTNDNFFIAEILRLRRNEGKERLRQQEKPRALRIRTKDSGDTCGRRRRRQPLERGLHDARGSSAPRSITGSMTHKVGFCNTRANPTNIITPNT